MHGARLSDDDRAALADLVRRARPVEADRNLVDEGREAPRAFAVLEGWACRWKADGEGRRQITDLLLPGDVCHPHVGLLRRADHSIDTLSPCRVAEIDPGELAETMERSPAVRGALRWSSLQTDSILRETVVNNGRRLAPARIAHLICEVTARLAAVGLAEGGGFPWPVTQEELAEIASLTPVHVNRTLKELRGAGLIVLKDRLLRVPDAARLAASCDFRPGYLHLAPVPVPAADGTRGAPRMA